MRTRDRTVAIITKVGQSVTSPTSFKGARRRAVPVVCQCQAEPRASTATVSSLSHRDAAPSTRFRTQRHSVVVLQIQDSWAQCVALQSLVHQSDVVWIICGGFEPLIRMNFQHPTQRAAEAQRPITTLSGRKNPCAANGNL